MASKGRKDQKNSLMLSSKNHINLDVKHETEFETKPVVKDKSKVLDSKLDQTLGQLAIEKKPLGNELVPIIVDKEMLDSVIHESNKLVQSKILTGEVEVSSDKPPDFSQHINDLKEHIRRESVRKELTSIRIKDNTYSSIIKNVQNSLERGLEYGSRNSNILKSVTRLGVSSSMLAYRNKLGKLFVLLPNMI